MPDCIETQPITAIILAGGRGQRVGGADKGWLIWRERPLIDYATAIAKTQTHQIIISCNRNQARYAALGWPVVGDLRADFQGPLAGIEAALALCTTPLTLVLPCDTPNLTSDLLRQLHHGMLTSGADAVFARDTSRDHYLVALWRTDLRSELRNFLDSGERAVKAFYRRVNAQAIAVSAPDDAFANVNAL